MLMNAYEFYKFFTLEVDIVSWTLLKLVELKFMSTALPY